MSIVATGMADDESKGKKNSFTSSNNPHQTLQVAAPFMTKTYEMVSDARTDALIHWGTRNNTFIVPDPSLFSHLLLPSYFKHGNFSSFVRQLNTYGFRKVDPDRWEFAHESFLRGQAHLLPIIIRRRVRKDVVSIDKEEEEEEEKDEDERLLQEVGMLRSQQRVLEDELVEMNRRLEVTERKPQQMMSFLARVAGDPGFLPRLINSKIAGDKRRRLLLVPPLPPPPPPPPQYNLQYFEMGTTLFPMGSYDDGLAIAPAIARGGGIVSPEFGVTGSSSAAAFPFSILGEGFL